MCSVQVQHRPHIVLPLSLVFSKKLRLVVDASSELLEMHIFTKCCRSFESILHQERYSSGRPLSCGENYQEKRVSRNVTLHISKNFLCSFMVVNDLDSG